MISRKKTFFIFLTVTFIVYSTYALGFWLIESLNKFNSFNQPLQRYVQNHHQELVSDVFSKTFTDSENCNLLTTVPLRQNCWDQVTNYLALTIKEEELTVGEFYWPHDLFFVKQTQGNYDRIGWGGKVERIHNPVPENLPYPLNTLTGNCQPFEETLNYLPDCQIYTQIDLGNSSTGYLVRRLPATEEDDLLFIYFIPPFGSLLILLAIFLGRFNDLNNPYLWNELAILVTILAVSYAITYYLVKRENSINKH